MTSDRVDFNVIHALLALFVKIATFGESEMKSEILELANKPTFLQKVIEALKEIFFQPNNNYTPITGESIDEHPMKEEHSKVVELVCILTYQLLEWSPSDKPSSHVQEISKVSKTHFLLTQTVTC